MPHDHTSRRCPVELKSETESKMAVTRGPRGNRERVSVFQDEKALFHHNVHVLNTTDLVCN